MGVRAAPRITTEDIPESYRQDLGSRLLARLAAETTPDVLAFPGTDVPRNGSAGSCSGVTSPSASGSSLRNRRWSHWMKEASYAEVSTAPRCRSLGCGCVGNARVSSGATGFDRRRRPRQLGRRAPRRDRASEERDHERHAFVGHGRQRRLPVPGASAGLVRNQRFALRLRAGEAERTTPAGATAEGGHRPDHRRAGGNARGQGRHANHRRQAECRDGDDHVGRHRPHPEGPELPVSDQRGRRHGHRDAWRSDHRRRGGGRTPVRRRRPRHDEPADGRLGARRRRRLPRADSGQAVGLQRGVPCGDRRRGQRDHEERQQRLPRRHRLVLRGRRHFRAARRSAAATPAQSRRPDQGRVLHSAARRRDDQMGLGRIDWRSDPEEPRLVLPRRQPDQGRHHSNGDLDGNGH